MSKGSRPALADGNARTFEERLAHTLSVRARTAGVPVGYLTLDEAAALLRSVLRLPPDDNEPTVLELLLVEGKVRARLLGIDIVGSLLRDLDRQQLPTPPPPRQRPRRRPSRL